MKGQVSSAIAVLLVVLGVVLSLRHLLPYISPFILALLAAALIDAPVNRLERWGMNRSAAVLTTLAIMALCFAGAMLLLTINLLQDLLSLVEQLPSIGQRLQDYTSRVIHWAGNVSAGLPQPVADALRGSAGRLTVWVEAVVHGLLRAILGLPNMLANLTVAAFATFFLSRDGRRLSYGISRNLPPAWRNRILHVNREIFSGIVGFVRAQVILVCLAGALSTAVFSAFGIPYAWLLGVAAGVLDLLPMVGLSGVFIPVIVMQWVAGRASLALGIATAWGVVLLIRQSCEPALVGSGIGLHPLSSLAAMFIGVQAWGLAGVFLGPLVATSLKALWLGALRPLLFEG